MIEYLLMVQICSNIDGDCQWQRIAKFPTEEICIANGLSTNPFTLRFKCVILEKRLGPDQRTPLPRPRPNP